MSLKAFHLIFIALSILVCVFTGAWGIWASRADSQPDLLLMTFFGFSGAVWLSYYGVRVFSKFFGHGGGHA